MFRLRALLNQTPPLSEKLKIFALDDKSVAYLGDNEMSLEDLTLMLENIAKQKPHAIILDRLFAEPPAIENRQKWMQRLKDIQVPLYSGAYFNRRPIAERQNLQTDADRYGVQAFGGSDPAVLDLFPNQEGYLYGYAPAYEGVFEKVGHIRLTEDGSFHPILLHNKTKIIPHLGLYAAKQIEVRGTDIFVDGDAIPTTDAGLSYINHRPPLMFYQHEPRITRSMKSLIQRARQQQPETRIQPGDVVLILFNFYTGSTDFFEGGPFGEVPGGLIVATIIDSVLQNQWLRPLDIEPYLIFIFAVMGVVTAIYTGTISFWIASILAGISYFLFSIVMFSYYSIVVPWALPLVTFLITGTAQYVYRQFGNELNKIQIEKDYYSEKSLRLEEENKKIKLEERLNLGKAVQEILLPEEMSFQFLNYDVFMFYHPAQEMSGDWIYIWRRSSDERKIILGDVVGKGPSAAIPVAVIIGVLGECERLEMSLEESLQRLNQRLIELFDYQISSSCTAIELCLDGRVKLVNAGSPGWFVLSEQSVDYVALRSSPMGMRTDFSCESRCFEIQQRLVFLSFTDGFLEGARGFRRLQRALDKENFESLDGPRLQALVDEVGVSFRLIDDRSMLSVTALPKTS